MNDNDTGFSTGAARCLEPSEQRIASAELARSAAIYHL